MTNADLIDAGRLLGWAARPKDRPARHHEYKRLVERYSEEEEFASICDQVALGAGLRLVVDDEVGVIAIASSDSPLRITRSEFVRRAAPAARRALPGLVLLSIAKVAYPYPAAVDDRERVPRVSVAAVAEYLNHLVERLDEDADDRDTDAPELVEVWRTWDELRQIRAEALRMSSSDRLGLVKKVCGALESEGLLSSVNDDDGGTWRATPRLRVLVTDLIEDSSLYSELYELTHDVAGGAAGDGQA